MFTRWLLVSIVPVGFKNQGLQPRRTCMVSHRAQIYKSWPHLGVIVDNEYILKLQTSNVPGYLYLLANCFPVPIDYH